jgi:hypothetical protein
MCACGRTSYGIDRYGADYGTRFSILASAPAQAPWLGPLGPMSSGPAIAAAGAAAYDPNCPSCRVGQTVSPAGQVVAVPYGLDAMAASLVGPIRSTMPVVPAVRQYMAPAFWMPRYL